MDNGVHVHATVRSFLEKRDVDMDTEFFENLGVDMDSGHLTLLHTSDHQTLMINLLNGGASYRWSFSPHSAWGSIESTTILTTNPSL